MLRKTARAGILFRFHFVRNPSPLRTDDNPGKSASGSLESIGAGMRFSQIDRITQLVDGESLQAIKCLSLAEGYLKDHFPRCPLMPGVVMLEAMFQASMWLLRATDRFQHPMVALRGARNIRFRELVEPGDSLTIETKLTKLDENRGEFTASGSIGEQVTVSGRLTLEQYSVNDRLQANIVHEPFMISEFKRKFRLLVRPGLELSLPVREAIGIE